ncbi:Ig-like domain-containing protein [Anaeromyxobacter diazotrophicus]|uniref:Carboxypeptidase regulatory-like domain-containing protein n=1 Tax=Anaeromyxobacter diazotrophicus TaxID=2590199 RepID=A0A7I9VQL6_9BACT|nr:Ig-like domain-containing protein [Anaeromyxobacter diazotrophicus]GEJ58695.1 hypothetical protein AMYX_34360 [Anaeromyxobacter diazotrophicus]
MRHPRPGLAPLVAALALACGGGSKAPAPGAAPLAADDVATARDGAPVTIDVLANDSAAGGRTLTVTAVGAPARGAAALAGGRVVYTPDAPGFIGQVAFWYTVSDGARAATATVTVRGVQTLALRGRVYDEPVPGATVTATTGGESFTAVAGPDGAYTLPIEVADPAATITLVAQGTAAAGQEQVKLATVLPGLDALPADAAAAHELAAEADPNVNLTNVTTARYALLQQANGGAPPADATALVQAEKSVDPALVLDLASAIKAAVDLGAALPAGCPDTLALAADPVQTSAFTASAGAAVLAQARDATLADPVLMPPAAPVPPSGTSYLTTTASTPGYLARSGDRFTMALDGTGLYVTTTGANALTWSQSGSTVVLDLAAPLRVTSWDSIQDSPYPQAVQDAYIAERHDAGISTANAIGRITYQVFARGALVDLVTVQQDLTTTWEAVTLGSGPMAGTYGPLTSSRQWRFEGSLRDPARVPTTPWTAALAAGTWAMPAYYAAGVDPWGATLPAQFNGEAVTLAPDQTGAGAYAGQSLAWSLGAAGELHLRYASGDEQVVTLLDALDDVRAVYCERLDAAGQVVAGTYDYAFKSDVAPAAFAQAVVTAPGTFWQTMINAWMADQWAGPDLKLENKFGWSLFADGSGQRIHVAVDPSATPTTSVVGDPLAWSTSGDEVVLDMARNGDLHKELRRFLPFHLSQDGNRVFVIERSVLRATPSSAYGVYIAPRLNIYVRAPVPVAP